MSREFDEESGIQMSEFVHPSYYHVFCRVQDGRWGRLGSSESINISNQASGLPSNQSKWDLVKLYGISTEKVIVELFRLNAGNLGYYLANLRDRQYHYCGPELADVQAKLIELGIGVRAD
jgi:hypothetical protein